MDDLGHLLKFIVNCIVIATEHQEKLNCDIEIYENILKKFIEKLQDAAVENFEIFSTINAKNVIIASQFLNCLEALMIYCYHKMKNNEEYVLKLMELFAKHQKTQRKAKKLFEFSKKSLKTDKNSSMVVKKSDKNEVRVNCIWNLKECSGFLKIIFTNNENVKLNELKTNKEFCKFVLEATAEKLKGIESSSDYTQMKYNRSIFESFLYTSMIIYQQLDPETFISLYDNSECAVLTIEAFNYAICGMETSYCGKKDKWIRFLKILTKSSSDELDSMLLEVIERVQQIIESVMEIDKAKNQDSTTNTNNSPILSHLFMILEVRISYFTEILLMLIYAKTKFLIKFVIILFKRIYFMQSYLRNSTP